LIIGEERKISAKAVFALVFYMILPIISIMMMIFTYPELSDARLLGILYRTIPISVMLILISQFQVRYEKGSLGRFILNEVYVLLVVAWLFALLGGNPVIHQTWEEYQFSLHIWNYIVLILIITGMNVLYYILEYQAYCDEVPQKKASRDEQKSSTEIGKNKGVTIVTLEA
jgi:hypothetical protein